MAVGTKMWLLYLASLLLLILLTKQMTQAVMLCMQTSLDDATDPWGVKVERVEMSVPTSYLLT